MGCDVIDKIFNRGFEIGFKQGFEEGFKQGFEEGMEQAALLIRKLFAQNRIEDLKKACKDREYLRNCKEIFSVFLLISAAIM